MGQNKDDKVLLSPSKISKLAKNKLEFLQVADIHNGKKSQGEVIEDLINEKYDELTQE